VNRRKFLATAAASAGSISLLGQNYSDYSRDPRPDVAEGTFTAGSDSGPIFAGAPVVSGPGGETITIHQPLQRAATGYLEYAIEGGAFQRVDAEQAGMLPFAEHVLKFRLPPLPGGKAIRYRSVARSVGWVKVKQFYHGELRVGEPQTSAESTFRTLDPGSEKTTFAVWNDTHENIETLQSLHKLTNRLKPDFLLWNGDQSNDVHFERDMARQFLMPAGLTIADKWPLAYVRGNHDVRGPAAWSLPRFTGTPDDKFYYAFRSGPLAALVMDTGEDKPDDSPQFGGWLPSRKCSSARLSGSRISTRQTWFREAPHKVLFCHIPLWFTREIFPTQRRWECHHYCRQMWLPALREAGVKLVISGHTHSHRWMPSTKINQSRN
jgi:predicted phosphodiesterase